MSEERRVVIHLKHEHKTAIQRIMSVFEQARKCLKLDNFISENKACIDKHSRSSFCEYEAAELAEFIARRLNGIIENITYLQCVTPEYIADDIARMICEKQIVV